MYGEARVEAYAYAQSIDGLDTRIQRRELRRYAYVCVYREARVEAYRQVIRLSASPSHGPYLHVIPVVLSSISIVRLLSISRM